MATPGPQYFAPKIGAANAYLVVVAATVVAAAARSLLDPVLGDHIPYATFTAAVVVAAWVGGLRPALLATALGFVFAVFLFVPPRYSFAPSGPHAVGLGMYVFVCLAIAGFGEGMWRARRRVEDKRERLRTTLASIGDAVITTDLAGRVINMNPVAEALTGWATADATGQTLDAVFRIVNEETREAVENPATRALREGVVVGLANHTVLIAKDGTERPIDDSAAPVRNKNGEVVGCVLVFRDITERHRAERESREAQQQIITTLESITDGFMRYDRDWRIVYVNAEAERINQLTRSEMLGKTLWELFPAVVGTKLEAEFRRAVADQVTVEFENHYEPFGRWYALKCYPAPDGGMTTFIRDVTDQKRAEQEVARLAAESERQRRLYETILSSTPDFVYVFSLDHKVLYANDALIKMWGRGHDGAIGKTFLEIGYEPWHAEMHDREIDQVRATRQPIRGEVPFTGTHGTRQYDYIFVPVLGADGGVEAVAGTTRDVTDRKRAEEELRRLAAELSEAGRRKDEFLATLAHELRNPLAPIRNGLQVIRLAQVTGPVEQARAMMERQLTQMVRLVDDLLDISRVTSGKLDLRKETVELKAVIDSAVETARPLIDQAGHELTITLPDGPVLVDGDVTRLAQVVSNLLTNSAKYTHRGGHVRLTVGRDGGTAVVAVRDNGIGIPPAMLGRVFDMFTQVDRTLEKTTGGLGIGLSLVKGLVEMHGGTIAARSEGEGRGSEFVVRLPALAPGEGGSGPVDRPTEVAAPPGPRRVLVVDDNEDAADSLGQLLELLGNEVRTAYDGEAGVAAAGTFRPAVVLCDIGMPKVNGYEACRRIRAQPWGGTMVLVALTGWGQDDDRAKSAGAGFDHHLVKPVETDALLKLLAGLNAGTV